MWGFQGSNTLGGFVVIPASSNLAIQNTSSSAVNVAGGIYVAGPGNFIGNGTLTINNGLPTTGNSGTIVLGDGTFTKTYNNQWSFAGGVSTDNGFVETSYGSNLLGFRFSNGGINFYQPSLGVAVIQANSANALFITAPSGGVNGVQITGSTTGNYPVITPQGTDSNIFLALQGKGTSGVQSNYYHRIGAGYVNFLQLAGSSTGNVPSIAVQGSDTNVGINFQAQGAGTVFFNTQSSGTLGTNTQFAITNTSNAVNYIQVTGNATTGAPYFSSQGSDTNIALGFIGKGISGHIFSTNGSLNNLQFVVNHTASAVNYISVTGATTGNRPIISAQGSDTNIGLVLTSKGGSAVDLYTQNGAYIQTRIASIGDGTNYLQFSGNTTGNAPVISAQGFDTNIGLNINTKGTGGVSFNMNTGSLTTSYDTVGNQVFMVGTGNINWSSTLGGSQRFFTSNLSSQQFNIAHTASAVNYVQVTGGATGIGPTLSAQGGDTNINLQIASKGNGAIQFATANGIQAVVADIIQPVNRYVQLTGGQSGVNAPSIGTGGGSEAFDIFASQNALRFWTVGKGVNPSFQASYVGSAVNYFVIQSATTTTNPSLISNGTDTNVGINFVAKGSGTIYFNSQGSTTPGTNTQFAIYNTSNAVNYIAAIGAVAGGTPNLSVQGSDTNANFDYFTKGTGTHVFKNGAGYQQFAVASASTSVNFLAVTGGNAGNAPTFGTSSFSSDTNINLGFYTKGTGFIFFNSQGSQSYGTNTQFSILNTSNSVNWLQASGATAGQFATLNVGGSDTYKSLRIQTNNGGQIDINKGYSSVQSSSIGMGAAGGLYSDPAGAFWRGVHIYAPNFTDQTGGFQFPRSSQTFEFDSFTNPSYRNYYYSLGNAPVANAITFIISNNTAGNIDFKYSNANSNENSFRIIPANGFAGIYHSNFLQVTGGTVGNSAIMSTNGVDSSVSMVFVPKGNGSVDISTSGYLNLSSSNTIYSLVRSAAGTSYTSMPTITISNPTTPGVAATANAQLSLQTIVINAGGQNYNIGDTLTLVGGANTIAAQLTVTANGTGSTAGNVTAVSITTSGNYSVLPTTPISVTGGSGTGATFTSPTYTISTSGAIITNSGSGYVEQPTVTINGGGGSGGSYYAQVGLQAANVKSISSAIDFYTSGGRSLKITDSTNYLINYWQLGGSAGGVQVGLAAQGSDTNVGTNFTTKGNAAHVFSTNGYGSAQFVISHTASAVNYVNVTGGSTGLAPSITAQGSDANVSLVIGSKGSSELYLSSGSTGGQVRISARGSEQVNIGGSVSAVNKIFLKGAATGFNPLLQTQGGDTNVGFEYSTFGTGSHNFYTFDRNGGSSNLQFAIAHTGSAVNYVQATGAVSGFLPSISAQGSDGAVSLLLASKGGASTIFQNNGPGSATQFSVSYTSASVNYLSATGATTTNYPTLQASGSDTNIGIQITSKGTAPIYFNTGGSNIAQFVVSNTANSVNYLSVTGATTTGGPALQSNGSDSAVNINYWTKGAGAHIFATGAGSYYPQMTVIATNSSVNQLLITGSTTNNPVLIYNSGSDTNIGINLNTKGSGSVNVSTVVASTSTTTGSLVVGGGVGIAGNVFIGGTLSVSGNISFSNTTINSVTINTTDQLVVTNTTPSLSTTTGSVIVYGGLGLAGNLSMNLASSSSNRLILNQSNYIASDSNGNVTFNGNGFYYFNAGNLYNQQGFFQRGPIANDIGNNVVVIAGSSPLSVQSTTPSTSNTTGALVVFGGLGLSGNLSMNLASSFGISRLTLNQNAYIQSGDSLGNLAIGGLAYWYFNNSGGIYNQNALYQRGPISNDSGNTTVLFAGSSPVKVLNTTASVNTSTGALIVAGGVGIAGALNATTKSFNIPHPTKEGKNLRYGSLEGPEFGVYVRGTLKGSDTIELPDYWTKLVDPDSITVSLTGIGKFQKLYVKEIKDNKIIIGDDGWFKKEINCYYTVFAERADVDKLDVES
jgi:hypothetical protein